MAEVKCDYHDQMVRCVGAIEEAATTLKTQTELIFGRLDKIGTQIDEVAVRSEYRDKAIEGVRVKIENGLTTKVDIIERRLADLIGCLDRREKEREAGFGGSLKRAWREIKDKSALLFMVLGIWFVIYILIKIGMFGKNPETLFKFL